MCRPACAFGREGEFQRGLGFHPIVIGEVGREELGGGGERACPVSIETKADDGGNGDVDGAALRNGGDAQSKIQSRAKARYMK